MIKLDHHMSTNYACKLHADAQSLLLRNFKFSCGFLCLSKLCVPACSAQNQLMSRYQTPTLCNVFYEKEEVLTIEILSR